MPASLAVLKVSRPSFSLCPWALGPLLFPKKYRTRSDHSTGARSHFSSETHLHKYLKWIHPCRWEPENTGLSAVLRLAALQAMGLILKTLLVISEESSGCNYSACFDTQPSTPTPHLSLTNFFPSEVDYSTREPSRNNFFRLTLLVLCKQADRVFFLGP